MEDQEWLKHLVHRRAKETPSWCGYCSQDSDEPINEYENGFTE